MTCIITHKIGHRGEQNRLLACAERCYLELLTVIVVIIFKLDAHSVWLNRGKQVRILAEPPSVWFRNCNDFDKLASFKSKGRFSCCLNYLSYLIILLEIIHHSKSIFFYLNLALTKHLIGKYHVSKSRDLCPIEFSFDLGYRKTNKLQDLQCHYYPNIEVICTKRPKNNVSVLN